MLDYDLAINLIKDKISLTSNINCDFQLTGNSHIVEQC